MAESYRQINQFMRTRREAPKPYPDKPRKPLPGVLGVPTILDDPHKSYVYYIRFGERIKIGVTTNLMNRLDQLPYDEILTVEPGYRDLEQQRHREFRTCRVNGEWFAKTPELLQHIQSVMDRENELGPGMRRFLLQQRIARAS
jgi:hypothetical protein